MTDSICNFVPSRGYGGIRTVHFVYETDFHTLKQPFMYSIYYAFLVTSGKARVRFGGGFQIFLYSRCRYALWGAKLFLLPYLR